MKSIHELLEIALDRRASDLLVKVGSPPILRINGQITVMDLPPVAAEESEELANSIRLSASRDHLLRQGLNAALDIPADDAFTLTEADEQDLVFTIPDLVRVRANVYLQSGTTAAALRIIPLRPYTVDDLGLPPVLKDLAMLPHGLVLVTGPTGCGKSTTLAAMIEEINRRKRANVVTIEDPIEYIFQDRQSVIQQREVRRDTRSVPSALYAALRQSPDVLMVGEMRDIETIEATLMAAEVGHLVLATLHTVSAPATVDRIINAFPPYKKPQIISQLTGNLSGIVALRLVHRTDNKGRAAAVEVMTGSPTVYKLIEEGNTGDLAGTIRDGAHFGMISMNQSLAKLVKDSTITTEEALANSPNTTELRQMLRQSA